jgi:NADPH:quinone reductase
MKALSFSRFGGPEVLEYRDVADPVPRAGEVVVSMRAIGLNFADIYRRKGNYHLAGEAPFVLGYEGAGVVDAVGAEVRGLGIGDRVAFADVPHANAERVAAPVDKVIVLPADVTFEVAASAVLQGLTAHYLTHDSFRVERGMTMLVHAAAGGVGQLLVQIGKHLGARVLGLASSPDKVKVARDCGADEAWETSVPWRDRVLASTEGRGVDVVFDSVGATLIESLAATRCGGAVVFYGMAGGDPPHVDPRMLMDRSLTLTGGDLWNVLTSRDERVTRAATLFRWLREGQLSVAPPKMFPLREGARAHSELESRRTTGKVLLIP